jgi:hypothetical protein
LASAAVDWAVALARTASGALRMDARPVVHTSHPSFGYLIEAPEGTVVWAPEFLGFPGWAHG